MDILFDSYASSPPRQSFIIPLTYPDLSLGASELERISYGGDVWELRVDLLSDAKQPLGAVNSPSVAFVKSQVELLQKLAPMPILFTIRTVSQGGKFPDDGAEEALELMLMAVTTGCQYIDVEIEWPKDMIHALVSKKGPAKLVASFHSWTGKIRWTSSELKEKYQIADEFGDIIKLSILSADVYDCHELALFARNHMVESKKPILAVGMGQYGQLSRVLSPISLVTHKLLPAPSAPGQLTLAEVHTAQHLVGQLPKKTFFHVGHDDLTVAVSKMVSAGFDELGLPHTSTLVSNQEDAIQQLFQSPSFGGAAITFQEIASLGEQVQIKSEVAERVGWVDTVIRNVEDGKSQISGENLLWKAIASCFSFGEDQSARSKRILLAPAGQGAVRAACYTAEQLGFKSAIYLAADKAELGGLKKSFPAINFQQGQSTEDLGGEFADGSGLLVIGGKSEDGTLDLSNLVSGGQGTIVNLTKTSPRQENSSLSGWNFFGEHDILKALACTQFTAWTGRKAPASVMAGLEC